MSRLASAAIQEINRQLFEYAVAQDTHDWQRLGVLFSHGRYHFADEDGSDAAVKWGESVVRETAVSQHTISTVSIELDDFDVPTHARVRNYLSLFAVDEVGMPQLVSASWFNNAFEVVDGSWRWRTHVVIPIFRGNWTLLHRAQQFRDVPGAVTG